MKTKKPLNVEEYKDKKKVPLKSNIRIKEMPLKNSSYQDDQNDSNDEIGESE